MRSAIGWTCWGSWFVSCGRGDAAEDAVLESVGVAFEGPRRRIRRQVHRPQLGHPATQRADRVRPPDPLRDHRRRHHPETPAATRGSAAHSHQGPTPPAAADTSAGRRRPTPPSPYSSRSPTTARSARSTHPPTHATAGSPPIAPRSTLGSSPARFKPGSLWEAGQFQLPRTGQYSAAADK